MKRKLLLVLMALVLWPALLHAQTNFPAGVTTGASPPTMAAGTAGFLAEVEGTAPGSPAGTCASGVDAIWADSTAHTFKMCVNGSTATPIDSVWNACWFQGATPAAQMIACLANLPTAGGECDARCFNSSAPRSIPAEVLVSSRQILHLDASATFVCSINDNSKSCFHLQGGTLKGDGIVGQGGGIGITLANGANVKSEIMIDGVNGTVQGGDVENIGLNGNASATVLQALLYEFQAINIINVSGVQTTGNGTAAMFKVENSVGPSQYINDYPDCGHPAGACDTMDIISTNAGGGAVDNLLIKGGVYGHPGATNGKAFFCEDGGTNVTGVTWEGVTAEAYNATDVMWDLSRCTGTKIIGSIVSTGNVAPTTGIFIHNLSNNNSIENFTMQTTGGGTNTLVDTSQGANFTLASNTTPNIEHYGRQGFVNTGEWCETMSNGATVCMDNRGVWTNKAAGIAGGGTLATGSNAFAGRITTLATTNNILTPGFTCPNATTCAFQGGSVAVTAQSTTTETFSATNNGTTDYQCSCR